jgi:hypothetical protein
MKLTSRQEKFIAGILAGLTDVEAWRQAGYRHQGRSAAYQAKEAHRLRASPHISPILAKALEEARKQAAWSRKKALERAEAVNVKALEILMGHMGRGVVDRDANVAFWNSFDRLNKLCGVEEQPAEDSPVIAWDYEPAGGPRQEEGADE